jgi:hypothetical protein
MRCRQRRRKSHKPARAPEAVGPEWYAEQQAQLDALSDASLPPMLLPHQQQEELIPAHRLLQQQQGVQGPMQLRRPRRRSDLAPGDAHAAGGAAGGGSPPGARAMRVRMPRLSSSFR